MEDRACHPRGERAGRPRRRRATDRSPDGGRAEGVRGCGCPPPHTWPSHIFFFLREVGRPPPRCPSQPRRRRPLPDPARRRRHHHALRDPADAQSQTSHRTGGDHHSSSAIAARRRVLPLPPRRPHALRRRPVPPRAVHDHVVLRPPLVALWRPAHGPRPCHPHAPAVVPVGSGRGVAQCINPAPAPASAPCASARPPGTTSCSPSTRAMAVSDGCIDARDSTACDTPSWTSGGPSATPVPRQKELVLSLCLPPRRLLWGCPAGLDLHLGGVHNSIPELHAVLCTVPPPPLKTRGGGHRCAPFIRCCQWTSSCAWASASTCSPTGTTAPWTPSRSSASASGRWTAAVVCAGAGTARTWWTGRSPRRCLRRNNLGIMWPVVRDPPRRRLARSDRQRRRRSAPNHHRSCSIPATTRCGRRCPPRGVFCVEPPRRPPAVRFPRRRDRSADPKQRRSSSDGGVRQQRTSSQPPPRPQPPQQQRQLVDRHALAMVRQSQLRRTTLQSLALLGGHPL